MFTDCCIGVGETTIKVHKGILVARSPVFYNIFNGSSRESQTDVFETRNFSVEVVEKMIRYIYTDDTSDIKNMASEMLAIVAEYGLDGLKEVAVEYLCDDLNIGNICELFIFSETFGSEELKECCEEFIINNFGDLKKTDKWTELVRNHLFLVESLLSKSLDK